VNSDTPDIHRATAEYWRAVGWDAAVAPGAGCCGAPHSNADFAGRKMVAPYDAFENPSTTPLERAVDRRTRLDLPVARRSRFAECAWMLVTRRRDVTEFRGRWIAVITGSTRDQERTSRMLT